MLSSTLFDVLFFFITLGYFVFQVRFLLLSLKKAGPLGSAAHGALYSIQHLTITSTLTACSLLSWDTDLTISYMKTPYTLTPSTKSDGPKTLIDVNLFVRNNYVRTDQSTVCTSRVLNAPMQWDACC